MPSYEPFATPSYAPSPWPFARELPEPVIPNSPTDFWPTYEPSVMPSDFPTKTPSKTPSYAPTLSPTYARSSVHSMKSPRRASESFRVRPVRAGADGHPEPDGDAAFRRPHGGPAAFRSPHGGTKSRALLFTQHDADLQPHGGAHRSPYVQPDGDTEPLADHGKHRPDKYALGASL